MKMNEYQYKTFEEAILEIFENGNLKREYKLVLTNTQTNCIKSSSTAFSFTSGCIEIDIGRYMLSKGNSLECELMKLYSNLKKMLSKEHKEIREEKKSTLDISTLTLFYYNKIVCVERLRGLYNFEPLYGKLIPCRKQCHYTTRNSADISYIYKDAFSGGGLKKDYSFSIEYGMKAKNGVSLFNFYTLTSTSESPDGCIAKLIDRTDRILRLQKRVYPKQENSLVFLIIYLKYKSNIVFKKEFTSVKNHQAKLSPYYDPKVDRKRTSSLGDICRSIIQNMSVTDIPDPKQYFIQKREREAERNKKLWLD